MSAPSNTDREALRRVNEAAGIIEGAVRLGASASAVYSAVASAVHAGADQYAADVVADWAARDLGVGPNGNFYLWAGNFVREPWENATAWNDTVARNKAEVIARLREAAETA